MDNKEKIREYMYKILRIMLQCRGVFKDNNGVK